MSSSISLTLFFLFASTFLYTSSNSFNITNILNQHDDFSTFNKLLSQTQLASTINNQQTVTVLALDNDAMSSLTGDSPAEIKNILSLHVVLDYYDIKKLQSIKNKSVILTTLFQSSGQAKGQQGFLNATVMGNGQVEFASAVSGSMINAELEESVTSEPFNISVLHISRAIPIMIDNGPNATPFVASSPLPAQPPNDDNYNDPDDAPSPPSNSKPSSAPAPAAADTPSGKSDSTSGKSDSTSGVSPINSQLDLAFVLLVSSFWWFLTVW